MTTANDLVSGALRVISSLDPGEAIPGADADNALTILNRMLKAWSAKNLMIPYRTLESFPMVVGQQSYTIGSGANFDTLRPDYITYVWRRDSQNNDYPLNMLTKEDYNSILTKSLEGLPAWCYYDPQYPNGVLYVYPTAAEALTLYIESLKPVNTFTNLQTVINLPGEYEEAIVYLLAQRLAPEYGFSIAQNPDIAELVKEADAFIKRKNITRKTATFDAAIYGRRPFNIITG